MQKTIPKNFDDIFKELLERPNVWIKTLGFNKPLSQMLIMMGISYDTCSSGAFFKTLGDKPYRTLSQQDNEESEPMGKNQQA